MMDSVGIENYAVSLDWVRNKIPIDEVLLVYLQSGSDEFSSRIKTTVCQEMYDCIQHNDVCEAGYSGKLNQKPWPQTVLRQQQIIYRTLNFNRNWFRNKERHWTDSNEKKPRIFANHGNHFKSDLWIIAQIIWFEGFVHILDVWKSFWAYFSLWFQLLTSRYQKGLLSCRNVVVDVEITF